MLSILLLTGLASLSLAAPQVAYTAPTNQVAFHRPGTNFGASTHSASRTFIPIISDNRNGPLNGAYDFSFETANGIRREEQGSPSGPNGAVVSQGGWAFTFPDGTPAQFSFVADENGYRVDSPLLPTPPPMPAHALEQIAKAERERAQGIVHGGQYDPAKYGGGQYRPSGHSNTNTNRRYN